ncbi:aminotransferase class IV [Lutimonas vermicola]|uniref:branched-chain-amino-acid transaminase n=1 Tax=Lutimonas vermicola TaxID=414288 RepID=A0ABU9KXV2_9FLAO
MVNQNGSLVSRENFKLSLDNRAFKYGDGIFDTLKSANGRIHFLEDHYFRLMSSMRMLRMRIPMNFTLEYYENQIRLTLDANKLNQQARIRVNVFRQDGGLYAPRTNEVDFLIEVHPLKETYKGAVEIELFKDFPLASGLLSTIKTNNRLINVLGSIYAKENDYQNCILINEKKELVEALNANIFLIKGNEVMTPSLDTGCINGIMRKKLIEAIEKHDTFTVKEMSISPFDLLKVDEVFLTNSIQEIQSVDRYRKKSYAKEKTKELIKYFTSFIQV